MTLPESQQDEPQHSTSEPWKQPIRFGYPETLRGLGGVVAPLLTGFSLTAIVLLLTSGATPPRADWASVAFVMTVACLLFSMQVAFLALARSPSPADILTWKPEVAVSVAELQKARAEQAGHLADVRRLWKLYAAAYDVGVVAFLAGVLFLLIPNSYSLARIVALVIAALALSLELWWTLANHIGSLPHPVVRDPDPSTFEGELAPLDAIGYAAVLDPARRPPGP